MAPASGDRTRSIAFSGFIASFVSDTHTLSSVIMDDAIAATITIRKSKFPKIPPPS
jgi:hypothetical protein